MATLVAFDIEATDLAASWGRVLCCSFCVWPSMETHTIRMDDYRLVGKDMVDDSRLVAAIRDEIEAASLVPPPQADSPTNLSSEPSALPDPFEEVKGG